MHSAQELVSQIEALTSLPDVYMRVREQLESPAGSVAVTSTPRSVCSLMGASGAAHALSGASKARHRLMAAAQKRAKRKVCWFIARSFGQIGGSS